MPSHSKWLWCPASGWDWVDVFQICVNRCKLSPKYQCCDSDAETKQIVALYYPCSVCLFFFPGSLLHFIVSFWAHLSSCLCYLGKDNGKTSAESVMIGWKVRLLNYIVCTQCVEVCLARLVERFIISTSKFTSGNSSWCCFDSSSCLLALFLVFLPSRLSTKYREFFVEVCLFGFFANMFAVATLVEGWD